MLLGVVYDKQGIWKFDMEINEWDRLFEKGWKDEGCISSGDLYTEKIHGSLKVFNKVREGVGFGIFKCQKNRWKGYFIVALEEMGLWKYSLSTWKMRL